MGTIGVIVQATLRCQPIPPVSRWFSTDAPPEEVRARLFRPSCLAWTGPTLHVLLEGHEEDVEQQRLDAGLDPSAPPDLPDGTCRGRVSVAPDRIAALADALDAIEALEWSAELGVGTVHVAAPTGASLAAARRAVEPLGGWLLRERGAPELDGWGRDLPNAALHQRIRDAFDPTRKLSPGRMPG